MTSRRFSDDYTFSTMPPLRIIFGHTLDMENVRQRLELVARTAVPVLIQGESGTGKELCAQLIHQFSDRSVGAFVKVCCPAIPHALLETELFGYEKGAFTGANSTKRGRVEEAHGGTLFLDEVGSLALGVQAKLLQVLQDGTFMRVGGHETRSIQTRVISVANGDLRERVREGSFRLDFLYRINALTIELPPLRQRIEDIPDLVDYFMQQHSRTFGLNRPPLSRTVMRQMQRYDWPGNIRQLDNLIRSYVLIGQEEALLAELMWEKTSEPVISELDTSTPISLKRITKQATLNLERQIILKVLKAHSWNRQKTAKWLKISYRSLLYKLNEVGTTEAPKIRRTRAEIEAAENGSSSKGTPVSAPKLL